MKIRDLDETDLDFINTTYKNSGFDYELPDINSPLFVVKKTIEDEQGNIIGSAVVKLTAEVFLFLDPTQSPKIKVDAMKELNDGISKASYELGLDQISCWIPPEIEKNFQRRLKQMDWIKSPWNNFTRNLV